jgi:hypothetical protein
MWGPYREKVGNHITGVIIYVTVDITLFFSVIHHSGVMHMLGQPILLVLVTMVGQVTCFILIEKAMHFYLHYNLDEVNYVAI